MADEIDANAANAARAAKAANAAFAAALLAGAAFGVPSTVAEASCRRRHPRRSAAPTTRPMTRLSPLHPEPEGMHYFDETAQQY